MPRRRRDYKEREAKDECVRGLLHGPILDTLECIEDLGGPSPEEFIERLYAVSDVRAEIYKVSGSGGAEILMVYDKTLKRWVTDDEMAWIEYYLLLKIEYYEKRYKM